MHSPTNIHIPFVWLIGITTLFAGSLCQAQTYTITTVAGGGTGGGTDRIGDGGPAVMAVLRGNDGGLAVDTSGSFYIADTGAGLIRKVAPSGIISVVAGDVTNEAGFYGDGGPAIGAGLKGPTGVAFDSVGNLYIADFGNSRIRKVSTNGIISTVAGGGSNFNLGGQATQTFLSSVVATVVDGAGNIFIGINMGSGASAQIYKVAPDGIITNFAGGGPFSLTNLGDGGPATSAFLTNFQSGSALAMDTSGNLYIADTGDNRIRKISTAGIITTVAGSNTSNFSGDGGPATSAGLNRPSGVAVDTAGNLYIADTGNFRIRKVTPDGTITSIAGSGRPGNSGDGGPAASAAINNPVAVAAGNTGLLYLTDVRASDGAGLVRLLTPSSSMPSITPGGVVPVSGITSTIQSGEWVSIYGTNLANGNTTWTGNFPVSLGGASVTINGKAAFLSFVSPVQINAQAPNDTATGPVPVVVTTAGGSATSTVTLAQFAPTFFLLDAKHVAGIIPRTNGSGAFGGGTYDIIGPTGTSLGYSTVAAKAGDVVELFGTGFGPTNPPVPAGQAFSGAAPTTNPVTLRINNVNVTPTFTGLSGAGLDQINFVVPAGLGTGDVSVQASVGGVQTPSGVVISLQ